MNLEKNFYLPTLDGWRAISILLVIWYHGALFHFGEFSTNFDPLFFYRFYIGHFGVKIFFAISGFLICNRILYEFKNYGEFNIRDFYIKRFFRIIPPYYFFIIFMFILNFISPFGFNLKELLHSILFTRIYLTEEMSWYSGHFWSLGVEEHFYIILSILFFIFKRDKTIFSLIVWVVIIVAWNMISFRLMHIPEVFWWKNHLFVFSQMHYMIYGCIFAYFYQSGFRFGKWAHNIQPIFLILFIPAIYFFYPLKNFILPIYISFMIYLTATYENKVSHFLLENVAAKFIGKISYSLYLWQQLVLINREESRIDILGGLQDFPINLIAIFIAAYASHKLIEIPFIKMGRRKISHKF